METKQFLFKIRMHWGGIKKILHLFGEGLILLASLSSVFLFIYQFGFSLSPYTEEMLQQVRIYLLLFFFFGITLRYYTKFSEVVQEKMIFLDISLYLLLFGVLSAKLFFRKTFAESLPYLDFLTYPVVIYTLLAALSLIHLSRQIFILIQSYIKPSLLFLLSFVFFILTGWGLLLLPNATTQGITLIDALFTAATSVCITGLTTLDIATTFTPTGHAIIMLLVQIGGIGVMTFTSFIALSFIKNTSYSSKLMLKDMLSEERTGGLFKVILNILTVTFLIEGAGAYLIYTEIHDTMGMTISEEIFFAIFHSITAFCSAGISTLTGGYTHPLLADKYNLHVYVSFLIIFGGLGFPIVFNYLRYWRYLLISRTKVWLGLQKHVIHQPRLIQLHSYIVIGSTLFLITTGFLLYFIFEYNHTLDGLPLGGKLANSLLGAVTPRTAGISLTDTTLLSPPTLIMTIVFMIIGAAPMSTGGGLKVTTVFVLVITSLALLQNKGQVEFKRREIASSTIRKAISMLILYFFWLGMLWWILSYTEPHIPIFNLLFESVSALSTVGLSLNVTPLLSTTGKLLLIVTMLVGRIGILTFFMSLWKESGHKYYSYPSENILM
ncbi:MAG: potassium transporter [Tannerellaceae bacterium]|nr:potassium transporter [Tannerellaceae bacterium]